MGRVTGQGHKSMMFSKCQAFIDVWLSHVHAAAVSKNRSAKDVGNYTISQHVPLQEFSS